MASTGATAGRAAVPAPVALLERDEELARLRSALRRAGQGRGGVALVYGEAGIGKTSLVAAFSAEAAHSARVLTGSCDDLLTPRTLGPFRDMGRGVKSRFGLTVTDSGADRDAVFGALMDELTGPSTVLVIEDVHWADESTLDVLRLLVRRIPELPALAVLTYRDDALTDDDPLRRVLGGLRGDATTRLALRRLTRAAVVALAGERGADGAAVFDATEGNPFFISEILAAPEADVPETVRDAVLLRVRDASPAAQEALRRLCVIPARVEWTLLRALLGDCQPAVAEAERRGLLLADARGVWFRHELGRRAVERALPTTERIGHHRAVLAAAEGVEPVVDPARLAHHAVAAGDADAVLRYGAAAARAAARAGGYREAAAHWERVLKCADLLPAGDRAEATSAYAHALYMRQRFGEGAARGHEAVALWEEIGEATRIGETLNTLVYNQYWSGDVRGAEETARRAVELSEGSGDSPALALACTALSGVLMMADDPATATWAERSRVVAARLGRPDLEANALNCLGVARMTAGNPDGEELLRRGVELARGIPHHLYVVRLATNLARVMLREHRPLDARPWLETGLAYAAEHEFELGMYRLLALRAIAWLQLGQWDEAERGLRELLDTRRDPGIAVSHVLAALGRLLVRRGSEEGDTLLRRAREVGERTGEAQRLIEAGLGLVEGAWLAGDRRAARELAAAPLEAARRRGLVHAQGELLTYLGRAGERVAGFAECPEPFAAGLAGRWQDAAEGWRRRGNPYEQALELAASGAQDPTVEALGVLDGIGSGATGRVVRRQLRDLGVTRIPRGPAPATRENPGGLTQRQLDVLTLLGEGLSNAEIAARLVVSVRTVDHHVSAILAKLGLTSRRDARSAVAGLGVRSRP